jgi:hypothetical protein
MSDNSHSAGESNVEGQSMTLTHSVTCTICGQLADERRTVNIIKSATDERPSLARDNPFRAFAITTAANEFGEGEAHSTCFDIFQLHLFRNGARLAEPFDIYEHYEP